VKGVDDLRGQGRWDEALELTDDPLRRADILNEQALFTGLAEAREEATRQLLRAEARLVQERGRVLHAAFLSERVEDPAELQLFCRSLELAREAGDEQLESWAEFWIGIVHQVVRDDQAKSLPHFEAAYAWAKENGDTLLQSYAVRHLGFAWYEDGRRDAGLQALEESVDLRRRDGFLPGVAAGLLTLAEIADEEGRPVEARRLLEEAKEAADESGAKAFGARIDDALARLST
jgi:tetratricopeptide (TPR) repeat protein